MNRDQIEGNWMQLTGNFKQQLGKLTDDQSDVIAGKRDRLAGKIQETCGVTKADAEQQLSDWRKDKDCCNKEAADVDCKTTNFKH